MKILFVTDLYPVKNDEIMTPKTLYNFVQGWKKTNVEVNIIKPNFILNSFLRGKSFYKTGQYKDVYNINYWTPFMFNIKEKLNRCCYKCDYDIVVAHMPSGILFAEKLGLPFVAGIHNSDLEVLTNPLYALYFKKRLKTALYKAKAVACRSYVIKNKLLKLYPDLEYKTFVAASGIDENIIIEKEVVQNQDITKVLTAANLKKRKNIDKLIEACKGLENIELTVIGDGSAINKLKKLDKNVKFTGYLSREEVIKEMKKNDVFVLPSVGETFGMVYLEAMACGCITVGTKNDGVDGIIIDGENGFLTLPISTEIRKILLKIKNMDDEALKLLRYNSLHTVKNYTLQKCCDTYLQQILRFCKDLTP